MTGPRDVKLHRLDPWYRGPLVGVDFETTCVDVETARIVGAAVVVRQAGSTHNGVTSWVIDPGVPIEPEATEIHGYTDEYVQKYGGAPRIFIPDIWETIRQAWARYWPVVIYNAPFDLTVLDREMRRHTPRGLTIDGPVIDPFVLDKLVDPYRRGSRKLADVADHYGTGDRLHERSNHQAESHALAALRIAWKLGNAHPRIGTMDLGKLGRLQTEAKRVQAAGLARYFRGRGMVAEAAGVDDSWPMREFVPPKAAPEIEPAEAEDTRCDECGAPMSEHTTLPNGNAMCPASALLTPEWTT